MHDDLPKRSHLSRTRFAFTFCFSSVLAVCAQSMFVPGKVDSSNSANNYRRVCEMCSDIFSVFVSTAALMKSTGKNPLVISKLKSIYPRRALALVHDRSYGRRLDEIIFIKTN